MSARSRESARSADGRRGGDGQPGRLARVPVPDLARAHRIIRISLALAPAWTTSPSSGCCAWSRRSRLAGSRPMARSGAIVGVGPRLVGRIMRTWGSGVPWWRVTNACRRPPPAGARPPPLGGGRHRGEAPTGAAAGWRSSARTSTSWPKRPSAPAQTWQMSGRSGITGRSQRSPMGRTAREADAADSLRHVTPSARHATGPSRRAGGHSTGTSSRK